MLIAAQNPTHTLAPAQIRKAVEEFFNTKNLAGKKVLFIIPDNTRSGPVGDIFTLCFESIGRDVKAFDILVALGTHQPMSEQQICDRLSITPEQKNSTYSKVKFFNHQWHIPDTFKSIGKIGAEEIECLSNGLFSEEVGISINKMIFDYDEFIILGPVFPHEVVGFSGGHKYIFPGIAGDAIINFFHWLGAVITNPLVNGNKDTPTRKVVEKAASFIDVPHSLIALVARHNDLHGIFLGDTTEAWSQAADLSKEVHIIYKDIPYKTVLGIAPAMYDDLWTAGKVMYKLEPIVADGGTLIIYAPHITEISYTHGKIIDEIGYHTRDYFLKQWDKFKNYPRGVIAHSTHVKGIGTFNNGLEKPRINVFLATGISKERCKKVNLGYMNPEHFDIGIFKDKEHRGTLVVENAGEQLYRLSNGKIPDINELRY